MFSSDQIGALTTTQVQGLTTTQLNALSIDELDALDLTKLTTAQVDRPDHDRDQPTDRRPRSAR